MYYYVVLYKKDRKIPIPFNSWENADNFIHYFKLHAYITIKWGEKNVNWLRKRCRFNAW